MIIVASVSCIYGLGSPDDYRKMILELSDTRPTTAPAARLQRAATTDGYDCLIGEKIWDTMWEGLN